MADKIMICDCDVTASDLLKFAKLYHKDEVFRKSFDEKMKELEDKYHPHDIGSNVGCINIVELRHETVPPREFHYLYHPYPEDWDFERVKFKYRIDFMDCHSEYGTFEILPCKTELKLNTIRIWRKEFLESQSRQEVEA